MPLNESDTRAKLIDPALHAAGWTEAMIAREQTPGPVHIVGGGGRRGKKRMDYVLQVLMQSTMIPVAVVEAKSDDQMPDAGLEQAKSYARLHHVPLAYSSNGHQFIEHNLETGATTKSQPMSMFPNWEDVRDKFLSSRKLDLKQDAAKPLLQLTRDGDRYYQRAAVRAVLEHIAKGHNRALLSLATGTGKTWIAVSLLKALSGGGHLKRALFVCDRKELRQQALAALHQVFGDDAATVTTKNPEKNARVVVSTYQTLGIDEEDDPDAEKSFHRLHYPDDYFSHIIIDEAHRSGWGKWRAILDRNPNAIQIGLTATPRVLEVGERDVEEDKLLRDNHRYFGEPVYEYGIAQAMNDGFLAAMHLEQRTMITAGQVEREEGVEPEQLGAHAIRDAKTGEQVSVAELRPHYEAGALEQAILLHDRIDAMCADLFDHLLRTGGPKQKTLIFCVTVEHARRVAAAIGNRYATWANEQEQSRVEPYAFVCTGEEGSELLQLFKANAARAFVACTVDLISTGVDVPRLQNVVFFRYLKSPILFHQMLGRGTRIDDRTNKLHFTVYDYTNASRLLDQPLKQRLGPEEAAELEPTESTEPQRIYEVEGVEVRIEDDGAVLMVPNSSGQLEPVPIEQYRERIAKRLLDDIPSLDDFRERWIDYDRRHELMASVISADLSPDAYGAAADLQECDLYDVLASAAWNETARTRIERADRLEEVEVEWLEAQGSPAAAVLGALTRQFGRGGTDALERESLFRTDQVREAGGIQALRVDGRKPAEVIIEFKRRLLASDREWLL
ncbi:MAG: DEAD/DEAH box helicase family protein [Chloroflexi bacterium]|nr:DEAD/DEAH box helicase family protein [Chloroflexota bacterium]